MELLDYGWKRPKNDGTFNKSDLKGYFLAVVVLLDADNKSTYTENCIFNQHLYGDDVFVKYSDGEVIQIKDVKAFLAYNVND